MTGFTDHLGYITDYGLTFFPERPALLQDDLELSYAQLDQRANRVARGLIAQGLQRSDRVLVLWDNDIRFVEAVLGTIRAGGIAVPVNTKLPAEQHRELREDAGASLVLASAAMEASARLLAEDPAVEFVATVGGAASGQRDYEAWLDEQIAERPDVEVDIDDVAWQPYTSGSTGKPKGVLITHRMLLTDARLVSQAMLLEPDDRVIVSTPLFHMNASAVGLLPCLYSGASAYVLPGFEPAAVLAGIEAKRCTYITGVPAMYKLLLADRSDIERRDLSSLRLILCGSAPMPPALFEELSDVFPGATFCEGYGMTEVGPVTTVTPRFGPRRLGSIGLPLPGFEIRIVGIDDTDVDQGETGELWVRSACTTIGYHRRPDEVARRFKPGGWFATGDLVTADAEGWLYFRGRADDMMSVGGENVYPAEVEAVLAQHPHVRDVCVVPAEHDTKGQAPVAYVVLDAGLTVSTDELREFFLERAPAYAHPRRIIFLEALPLSGTGKVDRRGLTRQATDAVRAVETS